MRSTQRLAVLGFLALCGCGDKFPPSTDAAKGRETLKVVMDAWQKGMSIEGFKKSGSGITVKDPDWEAGQKLVKYEVDPTDGRSGVDLLLTVTLTLAGDGGKNRERTVNYVVGIGSQTVVLRKT